MGVGRVGDTGRLVFHLGCMDEVMFHKLKVIQGGENGAIGMEARAVTPLGYV